MHHHSPHSGHTRTAGEAFITFGALVGFFAIFILGELTWHSFWLLAGMLVFLTIFYWLLLLARFIFIAMVSGTEHGFDWEKYVGKKGHEEGCCGGGCCEEK